jgi:hypothetical protein
MEEGLSSAFNVYSTSITTLLILEVDFDLIYGEEKQKRQYIRETIS